MIQSRLRLLDTEALAIYYDVAPGTIRRWASEDRWRPYGTRRHRFWNLTEVKASWRKRRELDNAVTSSEHDEP
jgi:23S rRNA G2445 N2-methylase RlmL